MNSVPQNEFLAALEQSPMSMGILNVTPDSFSDGGKFGDPTAAVAHAKQMVAEGAAIVDIGGESTRPGAELIDVATEWQRIEPVLRQLRAWLKGENPRRIEQGLSKIWLSVDTYKAEIACRSLDLGADMINDVSGGRSEPEILAAMAQATEATYVLMHNPFAIMGLPPHARKENISYSHPVSEVAAELRQLYDHARSAGCQHMVIDPGLGFGKDRDCNWQILANLESFGHSFCSATETSFCPPILVGASNKRFLRYWQEREELAEKQSAYERFLSANLAVCASAILGGAQIVRSHEVREHYRCLRSAWEVLRHRKGQLPERAA